MVLAGTTSVAIVIRFVAGTVAGNPAGVHHRLEVKINARSACRGSTVVVVACCPRLATATVGGALVNVHAIWTSVERLALVLTRIIAVAIVIGFIALRGGPNPIGWQRRLEVKSDTRAAGRVRARTHGEVVDARFPGVTVAAAAVAGALVRAC